MHCVCLGVMRQMLNLLIKIRKKEFSLNKTAIAAINDRLSSIRKCLPGEFQRKQRTFNDLENWKATEFRMFYAIQEWLLFTTFKIKNTTMIIFYSYLVPLEFWLSPGIV